MMTGKNEKRRIEELTRHIFCQYFAHADMQPLLDHLAQDVSWLGAGKDMKADGYGEVSARFERAREQLVPTKMSRDECRVRPLTHDLWLAQFTCFLETYSSYRMILNAHERGVIIYRRSAPGAAVDWEITYLHTSIAYDKLKEGEMFALTESTRNYRRVHEVHDEVVPDPYKEELYHTVRRNFEQQPEPYRQLLLSLTMFRSFTVRQAGFLCDNRLSCEEITALFNSSSFLPFDYKKGTYSFHPLFKTLLRNAFSALPQEVQSALLAKAAAWSLANGEPSDALGFACRARNNELMLQAVSKGGLRALFDFSADRVTSLLHHLAPEDRARHLGACQLMILYIVQSTGLATAASERESLTTSLPRDYRLTPQEWAAFWVLKGISAVPDLKAMLPYFRRARSICELQQAKIPRDFFEGVTRAVAGQLFLYYRGPGQLQDNVRDLCEIYDCCSAIMEGVDAASWKQVLLGEAAYITGALDPSYDLMARMSLIGYQNDDEREQAAISLSILPRILLFKGRVQEFSAWTDYYNVLKREINSPVWKMDLDIVADFISALLELPTDQMEQTLEKYLKQSTYPPLRPSWRSTRHRLVLKLNRDATLDLTGPTPIPSATAFSSQMNRMYDNIALVIACGRLGQQEKGMSLFKTILDEAALDGAIMPVVEHASLLKPFLDELDGDPLYQSVVTQIRQYRLIQVRHAQEVILTPREKNIVAGVQEGQTNKQIAADLYLAEVTVKKILSTIYKKYEVTNRSQLQAALRDNNGGRSAD